MKSLTQCSGVLTIQAFPKTTPWQCPFPAHVNISALLSWVPVGVLVKQDHYSRIVRHFIPGAKPCFFHKASDPFERVRANRNTGGFTSQKSLFPPKNISKLCGEVNWKTEETLIGTLLFELSSAALHTTAWVLGQIWMELSFMLSPSNCRMMYDGSHRTIPRAKSE